MIAAIVYWNSTYLADAVQHLRDQGKPVPDALLAHASPLTWEHIGFSGDFLWDRAAATAGRAGRSTSAGVGWPHDRCSRPVHPWRCLHDNSALPITADLAWTRRLGVAGRHGA